MQAADSSEGMRAAFRDLHGRRLHGFALLLTLGDRSSAAQLAADAMADGTAHIGELRHPERAAAWLRARVVRAARGSAVRGMGHSGLRQGDRLQAISALDAGAGLLAGLTALGLVERAAVIASSVERLDRRDVATIVGKDGSALDALLSRARLRYARRFATAAPEAVSAGPVTTRVRDVAAKAMA